MIENTERAKRVLVLGKLKEVLLSVTEPLEALGFTVQGSTDWANATEKFDANDFEVIAFGSALVGPVSNRLRFAFARQNPAIRFVDAFGPIAVKQIVAAFDGEQGNHVNGFHVIEDGSDYIVKAMILRPCTLRIDVYRVPGSPLPGVELIDQSEAIPGAFERHIDARYREHGLEIVMTVNAMNTTCTAFNEDYEGSYEPWLAEF